MKAASFAWLFTVLPIPMVVLDADDRVRMVNPAWLTRAGVPVDIGSDALAMFATDSHGMVLKACTEPDGIAARFIHDPHPMRLRGVRLPNRAGVLLLVDDGAELAMLQAAQAQGLRLQAVGQLAAGIAHDFNNLLTAILGAADALAERSSDADTLADAANIRASGERGADMVRQLLALGGQQTLLPRSVAANQAIRSLAEMVRRLLPAAIRLDLSLETPERAIWIDPNQLDRALLNLVLNARDVLIDGGCIGLATGHAILLGTLTSQPDQIPAGRYVTISVSDDGPGMDSDLQTRIFEPFFTTKRATGGTGLGLATVLGIVHQSGGFLALQSTPGKGTCFTLYFPRHAMPETTVEPALSTANSVRRVLVVEDEEILRNLAAQMLRRRGWEVLAADSAETALEMLSDAPIAAVVSDMMMPGMDGGALVQAVRARFCRPDLPAILVSGYASVGLRAHATDTATVFLTKPYKMTDLADHLDRLIQARA